MLWLKSFHIIAIVAWFAGIFYLPRLFVYHSDILISERESYARFCTMERRLFWGIMTPSGIIAVILGIGLMHMMHLSFSSPPLWLILKIWLVILLLAYHGYCGRMVRKFQQGNNTHSPLFYRIFNEISVLLLMGIVLLVVLKPT